MIRVLSVCLAILLCALGASGAERPVLVRDHAIAEVAFAASEIQRAYVRDVVSLIETGLDELDPDSKIELRPGNGHHLSWLRFKGMGIGARLHHDMDIDQLFANLLHNIILGWNADKHRYLRRSGV